ncbi:MAG TPA: GTPase domain-containing protein [Candidatus Limnocylindria bacterium]|jgi:energy-coupling factor transporter ATP-binding protein EcfA2|nr:GTPase domain-containing protein [Candidatus Limnocylindria bacterium]
MTGVGERAERIALLAERRWELLRDDDDAAVRDRARQLREHVRTYVLPRAAALESPLLVVLLGPTGAGKSTLMNTLARATVSRTGVLRPTTRQAVLLATDADAEVLRRGALAEVPGGRLVRAPAGSARAGIAIVDAPDLDSIERANRAIADTLVEAADLCVFVTTATRYADKVPFDVLQRIAARGLPLLFLVNRLPPDESEQRVVLADLRRVLANTPLQGLDDRRIEMTGIAEGRLAADGESFAPDAATRVVERVDELAADRERRVALARRALAGALAGLAPLVQRIVTDLEHGAAEADSLRAIARNAYDAELAALLEDLRGGTFLRAEVLRHWESYVKADQITRFFSRGLGRIRGTIVAVVRGMPEAPVGVVEKEVASDVVAVTVSHASEAARRVAGEWSSRTRPAERLAGDPSLWSSSPDLATRVQPRLREWMASIAIDVQSRGAAKRDLAFGVSLGVNALAVAAMVGVFAHTAGVTGTEIGIVAATGFLNQKLLQAIFGEAAMREMIAGARERLEALLADEFARERARFEALVADPAELRALAGDLRAAGTELAT